MAFTSQLDNPRFPATDGPTVGNHIRTEVVQHLSNTTVPVVISSRFLTVNCDPVCNYTELYSGCPGAAVDVAAAACRCFSCWVIERWGQRLSMPRTPL